MIRSAFITSGRAHLDQLRQRRDRYSKIPLRGALRERWPPLSQQLAVGPKKRMRSVKIADRNLMGNEAAKSLAGKPVVEIKGRRLDLERRLSQLLQIEIDRVIGRRADRGRNTREHR